MMLRATTFALSAAMMLGAASSGSAGERLPIHMSGDGVFGIDTWPNIGTLKGGNAGVVLGDGSGVTAYRASGDDFTLGGVPLGFNQHWGANISRTTGILGESTITWPAHSVLNPDPLAPAPPANGPQQVHVTRTDVGDLYFTYTGHYELDLASGPLYGYANFVIVGGTGLFEGATGRVDVVVVSADPNPTDGADFQYEFDGFVVLKD